MTPEAQRIAIAEALGWKNVRSDYAAALRVYRNPATPLIGTPPINQKGNWETRDSFWCIPDYLSDLNAIHEAEKVLTKSNGWLLYCAQIHRKICEDADEPMNNDPETLWGLLHATAAQRAEAMVRTLGKWVDCSAPSGSSSVPSVTKSES